MRDTAGDLAEYVDGCYVQERPGREEHAEACDWELDCVHYLEWRMGKAHK